MREVVITVTDGNFKQKVLESREPVIVDFWAPWCRPCHMVAPVTAKLAKEYKGRVKFCKVNVDENREVVRKYQVMSIPSLLFFKGGQPVDQIIGAVSESELQSKVEGFT
jgi:thioredoxin 1